MVKYYSTDCKKYFDSIEEANKAEAALVEQKAAEKAKNEQRAERAKEVEKAFTDANAACKAAREKLAAFNKDYGPYHTTIKDAPYTLMDVFDNLFW